MEQSISPFMSSLNPFAEDVPNLMRIVVMANKRNPIAKSLRTPKFRQRVVRSRKAYDRRKSKRRLKSGFQNGTHGLEVSE